MGFDKIEAVSLTDQFVHKVESMIISGELMPGDQLPPARELSARMGVSRPVTVSYTHLTLPTKLEV